MHIDEQSAINVIATIELAVVGLLQKAHPSDIDMWRAIGCDRIDGVMTLLSFMTADADGEIQRATAAGIEAQERIKRAERQSAPARSTTHRASHGAGILR